MGCSQTQTLGILGQVNKILLREFLNGLQNLFFSGHKICSSSSIFPGSTYPGKPCGRRRA
jgi:hypothetical protein